MTNKEALEWILANHFDGDDSAKYCVDGCEEVMAMKRASEALEKQIPRTPFIDYYGDLDCMCPTCNRVFKKLRKGKMPSHCPDCGQAILWEE